MPPEDDQERLEQLARVLLGALGEVVADRRLWSGHPGEPNDVGLRSFFHIRLSDQARLSRLRDELLSLLRNGRRPNRVEQRGDHELGKDPETWYEFRFTLEGRRVYVKTIWNDDDSNDPMLVIKCLKLQD